MAPDPQKYILVVEDDDAIREILLQILEETGYRVKSAVDGRDAMRLLRAEACPPAVMLLDLMMPVMSGFEVCLETSRDPALAAIPIVIMSASGQKEPVLDGTNVRGYLRKPLTIAELIREAERYCG